MVRFATTILHSQAEAEDVTSDVIEKLWRQRERLDNERNIESLFMTATRNACYDHIRKRRESEEIDERVMPAISPSEARDTIEMMRYAISRLEPRQREVIHLKDIEGYSTAEIATIYEIEEPNVRQILSRGRKELRLIVIKLMQQ